MYIINRIFRLTRIQKQSIVLFNDILISFISTFLAFSLRLDRIFDFPYGNEWIVFILAGLIFIPFFIPFGLYQAIFRYSGLNSLISVFFASICYGFVFFNILYFAKIIGVPRSVGILQPLLFFILVVSSRVFVGVIIQYMVLPSIRKKTLIYGAGEAGAELANNLQGFSIAGFIDDDQTIWGKKLDNVKVFSPKKLNETIKLYNITHIFIAIPSLSIVRRREIISELEQYSLAIKILPRIDDLASGRLSNNSFNTVNISDLLDRNINWDIVKIRENINNNVILVTGAGGSIGSELCRQIITMNPLKLIILDHSENNLYKINKQLEDILVKEKYTFSIIPILASIRDENKINNIMSQYKPHCIYHAAAYKHVPLIENNIIEAINNNVLGTWILANAAIKFNCKKFTLISTDKAVRPTNVMGASKRLAEMCMQTLANNQSKTIFSMVRFGNVLGSDGSVVPLFNQQIEQGGPITVTHPEVTRYFMTVQEAVGLVLETNVMAEGGEVYVLNMGKPVKIIELARKMIRLSGLTEKTNINKLNGDIEIKYIGLRPGEKMYEELLIDKSSFQTPHPDIMMAKENFLKFQDFSTLIEDLTIAVNNNDNIKIIDLLVKNCEGFKSGK